MRLYDHPESANCYKVRLALSYAGRDYERVQVSSFRAAGDELEVLERAPKLRAPVLELSGGRRLAEANVICWHVMEPTEWVPTDAWLRARAMQWMFFEQWRLLTSIGRLRYWYMKENAEARGDLVTAVTKEAHVALAVLDRALSQQDWLVGDLPSVADTVMFPLIHLADEAGIDIAPYHALSQWQLRMALVPGFVGLQD